jgi:hypothetical protein
MTSAPIPPAQSVPAQSNEDILMELAASLEPDGGMPGKSDSERLARTVAVLFAFISEGHTLSAGAFRSHVRRLVSFLKTARSQTGAERTWIDRAVAAASTGSAPQADWFALAQNLTKLHDHL